MDLIQRARPATRPVVSAGSVLVVEDDPDVQELVRFSLDARGWDVAAVGLAADALVAARAIQPDVVVLDLGLPDADGREVLAALKADERTSWIPVVVLSALGDRPVVSALLRAGAQDFVVKPFDIDELEARLTAARRVAVEHRALAASEADYRLLAERATDVVVRIAFDGTVLYASPSVRTVFGWDPAEIVGTDRTDWVHPDDVPANQAQLAEATAHPGDTYRMLARLRHRDGQWVWCENVRSVSVDPRTGMAEVHVSIRDVTDRVTAEAVLREAEERFRSTFEGAPIGIALVAPDGSWLRVNQALCTIIGYEPDELSRMTFQDITHPDDLDTDLALVKRMVDSEIDHYQVDKRYFHADGHVVWIQLDVSLARDRDGQPVHFIAHVQDISERRQHEADLRDAKERFAQGFESAPIGMALMALDGRYLEVNRALCEILGHRASELCAMRELDVTHPDDLQTTVGAFARLRSGELESFQTEKRFRAADGRAVWGFMSAATITDDSGRPAYLIVQVQDITDRKVAEQLLVHRALHDPLTSLPNRLLLLDRLAQAMARDERRPGHVAVLFLDLDRFKVVNDSLGHDVGDALLAQIAERLAKVVRPGDTVARLGGDEFVILAEDVDGARGARELAERLRATVAEPITIDGVELVCTTSIGIALPSVGQTADEVLREADTAMYQAKERGKDRHAVFDDALRVRAVARLRTEQRLRNALDHDGVVVLYQPIIDLATGRIAGAEALARIRDGSDLLAPADFLEVAEESGLIVPLGARVLTTAVAVAADLRHRFGANALRRMAVNVSARQLGLPDFEPLIRRALSQHQLDSSALCLELTETSLLSAAGSPVRALTQLKEIGIKLAIDDFGTGYSSLTYLRRFPVDVVKIDRSFIDGMPGDAADTTIVNAVISLADALDLTVVAEGVENASQLAYLRQRGCDQAQGYYVAEPVSADALADLLRAGRTW